MKEDVLNRQEDVDRLIEFVECVSKNKNECCFALEGKWGVGKSYVLDMFEKQISQIQSEDTYNDKYFVFNYNCWKYDYYEEPSIALVSAMIDNIQRKEKLFGENTEAFLKSSVKKAKDILEDIASDFIKNKIGVDLVEIVKNIKEDADKEVVSKHDFDLMFAFKKTLNSTREKIKELAKDKTIIFIVDELDRCLPSYAIKVLERLHQLFEGIENIILIISIDRTQLEYSIKQIYGDDVDVDKYLKKFINFSIILSEGKINENINEKYKDYFEKFVDFSDEDKVIFDEMIKILFEGIDIRTQEKLFYRAMLVHNKIIGDEMLNSSLLCFEVMHIVFSYLCKNNNLNWLPEINSSINYEINKKIGVKRENYLKEFEKKIGKGNVVKNDFENTKRYRCINNNIYSYVWWIWASVYSSNVEKMRLNYYYDNYECLEKEVEFAKKFKRMCEIIK